MNLLAVNSFSLKSPRVKTFSIHENSNLLYINPTVIQRCTIFYRTEFFYFDSAHIHNINLLQIDKKHMIAIAVGYRKQLLDNNLPFIPQSMSTKTLPAGLSMLFYWPICMLLKHLSFSTHRLPKVRMPHSYYLPITYCVFYPIRFPIVIFSEKHHSVFRKTKRKAFYSCKSGVCVPDKKAYLLSYCYSILCREPAAAANMKHGLAVAS